MPTNVNRRRFLQAGATALAASPLLSAFYSSPFAAAEENLVAKPTNDPMIWGVLLNLGQNMWGDGPQCEYKPPVAKFSCEEAIWDELTEKSVEAGLNMVVIDIGEAIQYKSHPEIAVEGAWSLDKLRSELARLRKMGLEPIPKLNFSACHDFWLGEYARMLSTSTYYKVCADLIKEVVDLFDGPRFFHLGYDEETYWHQEKYDYVVIRQGELWKHDFLFFCDAVDQTGSRPWVWADYCWEHKDYLDWAPKHVLMSNWYYDMGFSKEECTEAEYVYLKAFHELEEAGYDQVPTGSNFFNAGNFGKLVEYCRKNLAPERLKGYLQTPWKFCNQEDREHCLESIRLAKEAKY